MKPKNIALALFLGLLSDCAALHKLTYNEFKYSDFGPQAMAHELLGMNWWQWSEPGGFQPNETFDVKVVVYCAGQRSDIEKRFPVDKATHKDYRYVIKNDAIGYLIKHINEDFIPEVTEKLKTTKYKIESAITCSR